MNFVVIDEVRTSAETFLHALYSWVYLCHNGSGAWSRHLTKKKKRKKTTKFPQYCTCEALLWCEIFFSGDLAKNFSTFSAIR